MNSLNEQEENELDIDNDIDGEILKKIICPYDNYNVPDEMLEDFEVNL